MGIRKYRLDTKEQSDTCMQGCLEAHLSDTTNERYIEGTTKWSNEEYRESDGKYLVPVCENYSNPNNYQIEEIL